MCLCVEVTQYRTDICLFDMCIVHSTQTHSVVLWAAHFFNIRPILDDRLKEKSLNSLLCLCVCLSVEGLQSTPVDPGT